MNIYKALEQSLAEGILSLGVNQDSIIYYVASCGAILTLRMCIISPGRCSEVVRIWGWCWDGHLTSAILGLCFHKCL